MPPHKCSFALACDTNRRTGAEHADLSCHQQWLAVCCSEWRSLCHARPICAAPPPARFIAFYACLLCLCATQFGGDRASYDVVLCATACIVRTHPETNVTQHPSAGLVLILSALCKAL
ncbi:hypothetical protein DUNSADRAFT_13597 [Dunaliella salina]|uniref:Encoded protein n=1 Tax=Dunaliella salina TaxID=3046 RepID=A0ABQ7G947_DUNSA|nr:hypothetical protein DUNSADRAFT_13597 [Dunaliella salina]|eukprot:KAF5831110.1 hypothetical protein DUNSADRAFT_13597 [Dunaliella salina]